MFGECQGERAREGTSPTYRRFTGACSAPLPINDLLDRDRLDKDERDYLEVLGTLIEAYEEEREPMPDVSDAAMLAHLIDARGVTQRGLAEGAKLPESTISDLLAGRREFNRGHIEKLAAYFKVSPAVFFDLRETAL